MACRARLLLVAALLWLPASPASAYADGGQDPPPRILLEVSPRAIEYQLDRLSNADLVRVDRSERDPRHRPIYVALLTRRGLGREYFEEALTALTRMDKTTPAAVLLDALPRIRPDDTEAAERVLRVLLAQPVDALRSERARLEKAVEGGGSPWSLQAAYGGMMLIDGDPAHAWQAATSREGHLRELLRSIPYLGDEALRRRLVEPVAALLREPVEEGTRAAAVAALGWTRPDAETFTVLAREVQSEDADVRAAAIRSLSRIPQAERPHGETEEVVKAIVARVRDTPVKGRTDPALIEAMQVAERLSESLGEEARRTVRRDLRALGVQVVRIEAVPEQMLFDRKWFAVEAGKPVQIVFYNPDAMAHNLLVITPGSLEEVGVAASTMPLPSDPAVKPYVPDSPKVLHATRLLNWGETERLAFVAPEEPGEYVYVCTFPGHWVRMYGVMLVVKDLEAWEASRTVPSDPMTRKPLAVN
jgi:azurin/DNA-binding transcriptional ArsR family regulator